MPDFQTNEFNKYKQYYMVAIVFFFLYLSFGYIKARYFDNNLAAADNNIFYLILGTFGLLFLLFDALTEKTFGWFQTVTVESYYPSWNPSAKASPPLWAQPKMQLFYVILILALTAFSIMRFQSAFMSYPKYQALGVEILDAIGSGIKGIIENMVFFNFLFPTLLLVFVGRTKNVLKGFLISSTLVALTFMLFHIFVYGRDPSALMSTVIFSYLLMGSQMLTGSSLAGDSFHFTNNVVASLIQARIGFRII